MTWLSLMIWPFWNVYLVTWPSWNFSLVTGPSLGEEVEKESRSQLIRWGLQWQIALVWQREIADCLCHATHLS